MTGRILNSFPQTQNLAVRAIRLGRRARIFSGGTPDKSNLDFWTDGELPWIGSGEVNQRHITIPTTYITAEAVLGSATKLFPAGSVAMALAGQGKTKAMVATMGIDAYGNQSLACIANYKGDSNFLFWWLNCLYSEIRGLSSQDTRDGLNQTMVGHIPVPDYDFETQKAIADFLDRETARIDRLIEKKQRLVELAESRVHALVDEAISVPKVPRVRFENVVRRILRPVILSEHGELVRLGLFNRGRGMFKKPAADEEGMGDSSFCFVREGDLILSGQFAWEGAVALATQDEEGCVVSHRYPVYRGKEGVNTAYLLGLLRSGFGDFLLNEASRGSAGRNRPLNTWRLGKEKIPVPSGRLQLAIDRALAFECKLKKCSERSISLLSEARSAVITAAVTGRFDVGTRNKQGQTDRCRDEMEEAI